MDGRLALAKADTLKAGDSFAVAFDGFDSLAIPFQDSETGRWKPHDVSGNWVFPANMPESFDTSAEIAKYLESECNGVVIVALKMFGNWDLAARVMVNYKNVLQWAHQCHMGITPTWEMRQREKNFRRIVAEFNGTAFRPDADAPYIKFKVEGKELSGYLTWTSECFGEDVIVECDNGIIFTGAACAMSDVEIVSAPLETD
jgi:hypothetical protein